MNAMPPNIPSASSTMKAIAMASTPKVTAVAPGASSRTPNIRRAILSHDRKGPMARGSVMSASPCCRLRLLLSGHLSPSGPPTMRVLGWLDKW